uniref:Uncharacterized protein n=1 Tax=Mycena chlorophos TaxID=658473 RepID=A0ABQ0LQV2_MYCCL|nr:predicted protein [Mycena chlorophos]
MWSHAPNGLTVDLHHRLPRVRVPLACSPSLIQPPALFGPGAVPPSSQRTADRVLSRVALEPPVVTWSSRNLKRNPFIAAGRSRKEVLTRAENKRPPEPSSLYSGSLHTWPWHASTRALCCHHAKLAASPFTNSPHLLHFLHSLVRFKLSVDVSQQLHALGRKSGTRARVVQAGRLRAFRESLEPKSQTSPRARKGGVLALWQAPLTTWSYPFEPLVLHKPIPPIIVSAVVLIPLGWSSRPQEHCLHGRLELRRPSHRRLLWASVVDKKGQDTKKRVHRPVLKHHRPQFAMQGRQFASHVSTTTTVSQQPMPAHALGSFHGHDKRHSGLTSVSSGPRVPTRVETLVSDGHSHRRLSNFAATTPHPATPPHSLFTLHSRNPTLASTVSRRSSGFDHVMARAQTKSTRLGVLDAPSSAAASLRAIPTPKNEVDVAADDGLALGPSSTRPFCGSGALPRVVWHRFGPEYMLFVPHRVLHVVQSTRVALPSRVAGHRSPAATIAWVVLMRASSAEALLPSSGSVPDETTRLFIVIGYVAIAGPVDVGIVVPVPFKDACRGFRRDDPATFLRRISRHVRSSSVASTVVACLEELELVPTTTSAHPSPSTSYRAPLSTRSHPNLFSAHCRGDLCSSGYGHVTTRRMTSVDSTRIRTILYQTLRYVAQFLRCLIQKQAIHCNISLHCP